ncbi:MAG: S-formylglutathione hydrolase, partial [Rickettsiales bacterium]|nr:S-formylglutathione hydrolase [Rickettsiales bacterium]
PNGAAIIFLSGLTCTEENFTVKAGAYRVAAQLGLTIVVPDTSPRGPHVPDDESIALGGGASFYVDATQAPWRSHYQMYSYIANELPALIGQHFAVQRFGLMGHSMGGHGALTIGQRNPQTFQSLSALAPVCRLSQDGWGPTVLTAYLGADRSRWADYDACLLMRQQQAPLPTILVDQGTADSAYLQGRLNPEAFAQACEAVKQPLSLRFHEGYDHGYFFIQSFIDDHLHHHAQLLMS